MNWLGSDSGADFLGRTKLRWNGVSAKRLNVSRLWQTLVGACRQERKIAAPVGVEFHPTRKNSRWHNHQRIQRKSIITTPPLITTLPRIIIIRPSIITHVGNTRTPSITRLQLRSIANKLTNIRQQRTPTLKNRYWPL